jgi:hypothetical protein
MVGLIAVPFIIKHSKGGEDHSNADSIFNRNYTPIDLVKKDSASTVNPDSSHGSTAPPGLDTAGIVYVTKQSNWLSIRANDSAQQLEIMPSFTIYNANTITCHAAVYLYDDSGVPLKTDSNNIYKAADGTLSSMIDFTPAYQSSSYNLTESDFTINLPYSQIPLPGGIHHLNYKVELFDEKWNMVAASDLNSFLFLKSVVITNP